MEKDRTAAFFLVVLGRIDGDKEGSRARGRLYAGTLG